MPPSPFQLANLDPDPIPFHHAHVHQHDTHYLHRISEREPDIDPHTCELRNSTCGGRLDPDNGERGFWNFDLSILDRV